MESTSFLCMCMRSGPSDCVLQPLFLAYHHDSLSLHNKDATTCTEWCGRWGSIGNFGGISYRWDLSCQHHYKPFFAFSKLLGREVKGKDCYEDSMLWASGWSRVRRRDLAIALVTAHPSQCLEGLWEALGQVGSCFPWEGQRLSEWAARELGKS